MDNFNTAVMSRKKSFVPRDSHFNLRIKYLFKCLRTRGQEKRIENVSAICRGYITTKIITADVTSISFSCLFFLSRLQKRESAVLRVENLENGDEYKSENRNLLRIHLLTKLTTC